ncbi:MAG: CopD family protein [Sulfitobacter sp.]|jgi:putative copper resistance protein D
MPDIWGLAAIVTKFGLYLGVLAAAGSVFAALLFKLDRYRTPAIGFAILGGFATVLAFTLSGANLTGDASGMTDPEMLGLLWTTPLGSALAWRLAGLGLLVVGLFIRRPGLWVSATGGAIAVWSFDMVGHVADKDRFLMDGALTFHLLAVALWIGILSPLRRLAAAPATWGRAADVGHWFGVVASITVPTLIVAGGYIAYVLVGSFGALISTGYGQALILKIVLVASLLGLAAANKLRFIPGLKNGDPAAAHHLVRSITVEWGVILVILALTAVLTSNLTLPM